jgi:serine/threonine protein kinase
MIFTKDSNKQAVAELRSLLYLQRLGACHNNLVCYRDHFSATLGFTFVAAVGAFSRQLRSEKKLLSTDVGYFIETVFLNGRTMAEDVETTDLTRELRSYAQVLRIITDLVHALAFMHEHQFAHLDIKPDNVMILNNGTDSVLLDVGLGCRPVPGDQTAGACRSERFGTTLYFAPTRALATYGLSPYKVMTKELYFAFDVYGLGLTIYDWGRGFVSYVEKMTVNQALDPEHHPGGRLPAPPYWPAEQDSETGSLNSLLAAMLTYNDAARITAPQALALCSRFIKEFIDSSDNPDSDTPMRSSLRSRMHPGGVTVDGRPPGPGAVPAKPRHGTYITDEPPSPQAPTATTIVYGTLPPQPLTEQQKKRRLESTDVDEDA